MLLDSVASSLSILMRLTRVDSPFTPALLCYPFITEGQGEGQITSEVRRRPGRAKIARALVNTVKRDREGAGNYRHLGENLRSNDDATSVSQEQGPFSAAVIAVTFAHGKRVERVSLSLDDENAELVDHLGDVEEVAQCREE